MKHLNDAHFNMGIHIPLKLSHKGPDESHSEYINVVGKELKFTIQDGPIKECGVNGLQITDVLTFCLETYKSLNRAFPCRENSLTITKIEEAILWQAARTKDRERRGVEGVNKE